MRFVRALLVLGAIAVSVWAVHDAEPPHVERPIAAPQEVSTTTPTTEPPTTTTEPEPVTTTTTTLAAPIITAAPRNDWPISLQPCGGDLPPCHVKQRESGGNYNAINPTGCGGRGCFGAWQFSGEWACKLGLPCDLATATPEQQDEAARILWRGGAGCSNWAAC